MALTLHTKMNLIVVQTLFLIWLGDFIHGKSRVLLGAKKINGVYQIIAAREEIS